MGCGSTKESDESPQPLREQKPQCANEESQIEEKGSFVTPQTEFPKSWSSHASSSHILRVASDDEVHALRAMVDETWQDIHTRDRKDDHNMRRLKIVKALRNENPRLWANYARARNTICEQYDVSADSTDADDIILFSKTAGMFLESCIPEVNEAYLFHGSKASACFGICQSDFMVSLAGSHAGTLYGPGIYLAESSSKSDEYADVEMDGEYEGLHAMLLCRATCGRIFYTDSVRPAVDALMKQCKGSNAKYHSVLGDREKARGTYREFVIYNNDEVYPEYIILYRREASKNAASEGTFMQNGLPDMFAGTENFFGDQAGFFKDPLKGMFKKNETFFGDQSHFFKDPQKKATHGTSSTSKSTQSTVTCINGKTTTTTTSTLCT